jgi:hypothetical protein
MVKTQTWSIEFWISPPKQNQTIMTLGASTVSKVATGISVQGDVNKTVITPTELLHVVLTSQDTLAILYINGEPVTNNDDEELHINDIASVLTFAPAQYSIDAIAVYAKVLGQDDILRHYSTGREVPEYEQVVRSIYPGADPIVIPDTEATTEDNEQGESHYTWTGVDANRSVINSTTLSLEDGTITDGTIVDGVLRVVSADAYVDAVNEVTDPELTSPTLIGGVSSPYDGGITLTAAAVSAPGTIGITFDVVLDSVDEFTRSAEVYSATTTVHGAMTLSTGDIVEELSTIETVDRLVLTADSTGATSATITITNYDEMQPGESISIGKLSSLDEFFDGNTEMDTHFIYQWDGAANASTSSRIARPVGGGSWGDVTLPVITNYATDPRMETTDGDIVVAENLSVRAIPAPGQGIGVASGPGGAATLSYGSDADMGDYARETWTVGSTSAGNSGINLQAIPVTPGKVYSAAVVMRSSIAQNATFYFQFLDANSANIGNNTTIATLTPNQPARLVINNVVAPTNAVNVRMLAYSNFGGTPWSAGDTLDASQPIINEGPTVLPFFSGNTPADDTFTYTWTGAVGNSTSQKLGRLVSGWYPANQQYQVDAFGKKWVKSTVDAPYFYGAATTTTPGDYWSARMTIVADDPEDNGKLVNIRIHDGSVYNTSPITVALSTVPQEIVLPASDVTVGNTPKVIIYPALTRSIMATRLLMTKVSGPGEVPVEYFDGDEPRDGTYMTNWTGTPNASTSEARPSARPAKWSSSVLVDETAVATKVEWDGSAQVSIEGDSVSNHSTIEYTGPVDIDVSLFTDDDRISNISLVQYETLNAQADYSGDTISLSSSIAASTDYNLPIERNQFDGFTTNGGSILISQPSAVPVTLALWIKTNGSSTFVTRGSSVTLVNNVITGAAWSFVNGVAGTTIPADEWAFVMLAIPGASGDITITPPNGQISLISVLDKAITAPDALTIYNSFFGYERAQVVAGNAVMQEPVGAYTALQNDWGITSAY